MNAQMKTLIAEARAKRAAREVEANRLTVDQNAVRMTNPSSRSSAIVSPGTYGGAWRITYIDINGPSGHTDHKSKRAAILDALSQHYVAKSSPEVVIKPVNKPTPMPPPKVEAKC